MDTERPLWRGEVFDVSGGMKVLSRANLTVTLMRRHLFGADRLKGATAGRLRAVQPPHVIHVADRARVVPPSDGCRCACPAPRTWRPEVFPYDQADGSQVQPTSDGADNRKMPLRSAVTLTQGLLPADNCTGQLIDVMAWASAFPGRIGRDHV